MNIKRYLRKKIIEHDLIPCRVKWKKSVSGIGRMYADILKMMRDTYGYDGVKKLSEVMYKIGSNQASEIIELLDLKRNLEGCAYALMAMHRIFGIKSKIVKKEDDKVVIHVTRCQWGANKKGWTSQTCSSISTYENGLVKGILASARHIYTKRRSLGDKICEIVITYGKRRR